MVLAYFMPEETFGMTELEKLTGYEPGKGTWRAQSMLALADMGFQTRWIEDFDYSLFIENPEAYLKTILDPESLAWQLESSNLPLEAQRYSDYLVSHEIEQRTGTRDDIKQLLSTGWLVSLEVNANPLAHIPGYEGHSVLVIGHDDENVTIHNPDGANGNQPNQIVTWGLLEQAWREFGGSYSIYAFKK